ncbi:hypothetical protein SOVF_173060 [Spinacia oleracea]|uniref:Protein yippee-like n=1 Tax=Spinacia oleracea TaxID=3562 RepID=A0A9R0K8S7_SPIOL|nr:protein yippee-like At3g11230 [Spinacia oleracea]KNA07315.1 hypothetical protein SOVF_173060 [Spinacia oleracea]
MGRLFLITLEGRIYSCRHCRTHLGIADDILSKEFHSRNGTAYLFDKLVNVSVGEKEERLMMTGLHTVVDIFCVGCGSLMGWKYEAAYEVSQKYKEGKYILERHQVYGPTGIAYPVIQDPHDDDTDNTDD